MQRNKPERRIDIDWLRVLAMLTVFLFHCARFFDHENWHVKNIQLTQGASVFVGIVSQWIMPLFFVISAMSVYYSLSYRKSGQFLGSRIKRLAIPFIFGTFAHIPLQVYFERVSHSQFDGSFIQFYPHYFDGLYGFGGNFAWMGFHLWYLEMLFIFSLMALPLFLYLQKETIHKTISRIAVFFKKPGTIFLLAFPLAFMELIVNLQPDGIGRRDFGGWSPLVYLIFFILGYLIASDTQFKEGIERSRIIALFLGVTTTAVGILLLETGHSSRGYYLAILRAFNSWFWLMAILGFGSRHLKKESRVLKYANEAVLPFYILHQTVIVTIGFYIANWNANTVFKYLIISTSSFVAIIIIYDLLVKRINVFRFLFGLKRKNIDGSKIIRK